jgi:hypothetical protein
VKRYGARKENRSNYMNDYAKTLLDPRFTPIGLSIFNEYSKLEGDGQVPVDINGVSCDSDKIRNNG